jgi:hypothetical protein
MSAVIAFALWWFTPIFVLAGLTLLMLTFALLSRFRGGRYAKPVVQTLVKVPLFKRGLEKASRAALEKQNPDLASAVAKLEKAGVARDPQRAQKALSKLTPAERRAYLDAAAQQQAEGPQALNRQDRRRLEKMQKRTQGR